MMNDKPFNVMRAKCPELLEWLKEISRYSRVEKFILPDYKNGIHIYLYTHNYKYSISARPPGVDIKGEEKDTYLGCTATTRKPRAGEDWNRGNDLADGKYCIETWRRIVNDIVSYELVKVVQPPNSVNK